MPKDNFIEYDPSSPKRQRYKLTATKGWTKAIDKEILEMRKNGVPVKEIQEYLESKEHSVRLTTLYERLSTLRPKNGARQTTQLNGSWIQVNIQDPKNDNPGDNTENKKQPADTDLEMSNSSTQRSSNDFWDIVMGP